MAGHNTNFSISVNDEALVKLFARAPIEVQEGLGRLVQTAAIDIQREMRIAAPVAVTGDLRRSIKYTYTPSLIRAEVGPDTPYANDVEYGGEPRWVSVAVGTPLYLWARQKHLNPYAVQRSIARKGTKPHPYVQPTYDRMKPLVISNISNGIGQLVRSFK